MRLSVPWDCIEVYPGAKSADFRQEFAAIWAERDILLSVTNSLSQELYWQSRASQVLLRKHARNILQEFEDLLMRPSVKEEDIHQFIYRRPELLSPIHKRVLSKLPFGKTVSDFVVEQADGTYILVELESATARLFNSKKHISGALNQAIGQVIDWKRYITDNKSTVERELKLQGISSDPHALIVIGRSAELDDALRSHLKSYLVAHPTLSILTYDELLKRARQAFENSFGRIDDNEGSAQLIYEYPSTKELSPTPSPIRSKPSSGKGHGSRSRKRGRKP